MRKCEQVRDGYELSQASTQPSWEMCHRFRKDLSMAAPKFSGKFGTRPSSHSSEEDGSSNCFAPGLQSKLLSSRMNFSTACLDDFVMQCNYRINWRGTKAAMSGFIALSTDTGKLPLTEWKNNGKTIISTRSIEMLKNSLSKKMQRSSFKLHIRYIRYTAVLS